MKNFHSIDNPYGPDIVRETSPISTKVRSNPNESLGVSAFESSTDLPIQPQAGSSPSGVDSALSNERVWTSGWYKSHSYTPGESGWFLDGSLGFIETAELIVGKSGILIIQTATGSNSVRAIEIINDADQSAILITKGGLGHGIYVSATPTDASVSAVKFVNNTPTSTNFYKVVSIMGGPVTLAQWVANNTTPNGNLTGAKGDICQSSNGKLYVNSDGGTTWGEVSVV